VVYEGLQVTQLPRSSRKMAWARRKVREAGIVGPAVGYAVGTRMLNMQRSLWPSSHALSCFLPLVL